MESFQGVLDFISSLHGQPLWYAVAGVVVAASIIIKVLWDNLAEPLKSLVEFLRRFRSSPAEKERIGLRHEFAKHILRRLSAQNEKDLWNPNRFTDLEAEYYAGSRIGTGVWKRLLSPFSLGPRRV